MYLVDTLQGQGDEFFNDVSIEVVEVLIGPMNAVLRCASVRLAHDSDFVRFPVWWHETNRLIVTLMVHQKCELFHENIVVKNSCEFTSVQISQRDLNLTARRDLVLSCVENLTVWTACRKIWPNLTARCQISRRTRVHFLTLSDR